MNCATSVTQWQALNGWHQPCLCQQVHKATLERQQADTLVPNMMMLQCKHSFHKAEV